MSNWVESRSPARDHLRNRFDIFGDICKNSRTPCPKPILLADSPTAASIQHGFWPLPPPLLDGLIETRGAPGHSLEVAHIHFRFLPLLSARASERASAVRCGVRGEKGRYRPVQVPRATQRGKGISFQSWCIGGFCLFIYKTQPS